MNKLFRWQHAVLVLVCLFFIGGPFFANAQVNGLSDADTALFGALKDEDTDAASAALKDGANINAISPGESQTPLMQSVLQGRTKMVKWALDNGANTTIGERDGYTPMHGAGFQGRADIAELLFKAGVPLREKHADGHEPAIRTCWGTEARHLEALTWFLDNGVPVDEVYDKCLERTRNPEVIKMLNSRMSKGDEL